MLRWWDYLIFLFPSIFVGFINCHTLSEYNVGALFNLNNFDGTMDLSGVQAKEAILMAIREINNKSDGLYDDILPNITFKLATEHPNILFSTSTVAANLIRTSFNGNGIRACIGPGTNAAIAGSATILRERGVFQIGYGGQDDAYGVKETFPSFVRINPASGIHARVMATFIYKYFRYERVAIIHSYNVYGYYVHLKFLQSLQAMGYTNTLVFTDYGTKDYVDLITQVKKSGATIFMLLYSPVTWAVPMLKEGWKQGLFQEGTQIFAIEDMTTPQTWQLLSNAYCKKYGITDTYIEAYKDYELSLEDIASLMKGFIGLRVMIDKTEPLARSFIDRWKQQMNTNYSPLTSSCNNITDDNGKYLHQAYDQQTNQYVCRGINFTASLDDGSDIFPSAFFAYDSILLLARSLHYFLTSTTRSITSQNEITYLDLQEVLNQFTSVGVTGSYSQSLTYELRSDNERKTDLSFSIFTFDSNHFLISSQSQTKETYEGIPLPSSLGLRYTGKLHSSQLFQSCQQSNIISNLCSLQDYDPHIFNCSCSDFIYDTPHNSPPHDLPSLQTKHMSLIQKIILIIFSILLFLMIIFTIFLMYYYRKCRYVKITQPELSLITFLGGLCICIAALITSFDLVEGSCKMIDIFCHLGYILLFSPLITKTWRLYLIIGSNSLKRIHITMRQTLLVVAIFVSITIILITIIEFHRPQRDYDYEMITDTPQERVRSKYCPAGRDVFVILLFTYESLVIIVGGVLCYLTRNLPSGISDSSQVANAIFGIIVVSILGVSLTQLTKMHHQDTLFVSVLLVLGGAIRALHVLYRSLTLKLLEGYDLDSQFQLVQVREPISFFALISKTRQNKNSNQTVTPTDSPKSLQRNNNGGPSRTPSVETGGRPTYRDLQNHSRVTDERQQILREIDILQNRLGLLANRALYASRLQQLSEPPDDFRQPSARLESQNLPLPLGTGGGGGGGTGRSKQMRNYHGSTVGLSASHRMVIQDHSVERQIHGTDSYSEDPAPLSYRSATDLQNPLPYSHSNSPLAASAVTALSLPLQRINSQQKTTTHGGTGESEAKQFQQQQCPLASFNDSSVNPDGGGQAMTAVPGLAAKKSGRYNPYYDQNWKTPEEKPGSEVENISDV